MTSLARQFASAGLAAKIIDAARDGLANAADDIATDIADRAPYPQLASSVAVHPDRDGIDVTVGGHGSPAERAGYFAHMIEFGTSQRNHPARPFVRPAAQRGEATVAKRIAESVRRVR